VNTLSSSHGTAKKNKNKQIENTANNPFFSELGGCPSTKCPFSVTLLSMAGKSFGAGKLT
jgi:hypothetical protein